MKKITGILSLALVFGGLVAATQARTETIVLRDNDRTLLSDWVIFNNQGCPPGSMMVKTKHLFRSSSHRCTVPQGKTVTFYKTGSILPTTTTYTELPSYVVEQLPPPPSGDIYVTADNNVYLINPSTRTVVESVRVVGSPE
jgi:hypothetical protein